MAMTIKQLLDLAWMSQASYLGFSGLAPNSSGTVVSGYLTDPTQINPDKLFAPTQAAIFADPTNGYRFVNYQPNDPTGFSATVFKSNSTSNDYTIAVRGTEPSVSSRKYAA